MNIASELKAAEDLIDVISSFQEDWLFHYLGRKCPYPHATSRADVSPVTFLEAGFAARAARNVLRVKVAAKCFLARSQRFKDLVDADTCSAAILRGKFSAPVELIGHFSHGIQKGMDPGKPPSLQLNVQLKSLAPS